MAGGGGRANPTSRKAGHFQVFPKCQRKRNLTLHFLPCDPLPRHPKRAGHPAGGKGWGWGCLLRPPERTDAPHALNAKSRPAQLAPRGGHFRSLEPALRQVLSYLAPPPAFVRPARAPPASGGPGPRGAGEGGSPRRCPRLGGARGDRGRAAGRRPSQRAGGPRPRRCYPRGAGGCPISPAGRKGPPARAVPAEHTSPHALASDSWQPSQPGHKKFRDAESDLKESFPWPLAPSPRAPG